MISVILVLALLTCHFLGDFPFQSDWMALNKSKNWTALADHVTIYTLCFIPTIFLAPRISSFLSFLGFIWLSHFITDAITSRLTSRLWFIHIDPVPQELLIEDGRARDLNLCHVVFLPTRHRFFVAIGADQLIHAAPLLLSWHWLMKS
jgi:hypothetical protein